MPSCDEEHASEAFGAFAKKKTEGIVYKILENKIGILDYITKSGESNVKVAMWLGIMELCVCCVKKNEVKVCKSLAEGLSNHKSIQDCWKRIWIPLDAGYAKVEYTYLQPTSEGEVKGFEEKKKIEMK